MIDDDYKEHKIYSESEENGDIVEIKINQEKEYVSKNIIKEGDEYETMSEESSIGSDYIFVPNEVVHKYVANLMDIDKKSKATVADVDSDTERKGFFKRVKTKSKNLVGGFFTKITGRNGKSSVIETSSLG